MEETTTRNSTSIYPADEQRMSGDMVRGDSNSAASNNQPGMGSALWSPTAYAILVESMKYAGVGISLLVLVLMVWVYIARHYYAAQQDGDDTIDQIILLPTGGFKSTKSSRAEDEKQSGPEVGPGGPSPGTQQRRLFSVKSNDSLGGMGPQFSINSN